MKTLLSLFISLSVFPVVLAQQSLDKTITHDGLTREYRLYIPASYNGNEAVPLLFNLHGYGSNNAQQDFYGNFKPIADTANFIICLPNGTFDATNTQFWNVGFVPSNIDDVGFISTLIDAIDNDYNIDLGRVYSTGMSNGGFMSYSLACELSNRIAAIASVTGSMTTSQQNNCNPTRPVPVMQIHGTTDLTVPYEGTSLFLHIDTLIKNWRTRNGCSNSPTITNVPDVNVVDGATATRFGYNNCNPDGEVALYKVTNGTHTWPGATLNLGVTCMDFNASLEIWKFFLQYRHPDFVNTSIEEKKLSAINIYPNPVEDVLNIEMLNFKQIDIYELSGKMILTANNKEVNVQQLPKGLYIAQIIAADGQISRKKIWKE